MGFLFGLEVAPLHTKTCQINLIGVAVWVKKNLREIIEEGRRNANNELVIVVLDTAGADGKIGVCGCSSMQSQHTTQRGNIIWVS